MSPPKTKPSAPVLIRLLGDEDVAKRSDDRDDPAAGAALRLDLDMFLVVVGALHAKDAGCQVDVLPAEGHELAAAKAGVKRRRPDGSISLAKSCKEPVCLVGRRAPLSSATDCGKPEVRARVHGQVAILDRAQGHEGVSDRRRIAALGKEVIGNPLDVAVLNVGQPQ